MRQPVPARVLARNSNRQKGVAAYQLSMKAAAAAAADGAAGSGGVRVSVMCNV
jgi:hypothetical protein